MFRKQIPTEGPSAALIFCFATARLLNLHRDLNTAQSVRSRLPDTLPHADVREALSPLSILGCTCRSKRVRPSRTLTSKFGESAFGQTFA